MSFVDTKIKQNCTFKQLQYGPILGPILGPENTNLLWPPLYQLQQTLGQQSQLPKTESVSHFRPTIASLPLDKSVTNPENKNKILTHVDTFFAP